MNPVVRAYVIDHLLLIPASPVHIMILAHKIWLWSCLLFLCLVYISLCSIHTCLSCGSAPKERGAYDSHSDGLDDRSRLLDMNMFICLD